MSIFKKLMEKNEFPILFIGSGLPRRYLIDFKSWDELLKHFWDQVEVLDFYGQLNILRESIRREKKDILETEIDYLSNIEMSSKIEQIYNKKFNEGQIQIDDFSPKDVYATGISPFKMAISKALKRYEIRTEMSDEIAVFNKAITKSQIMITTNYDSFIEDSYNQSSQYGVKTYIGQKGFFEQTMGYAELFKIHGSVEHPNSIVISSEDYDNFSKNSILISAKVISMLIHSPIIFFGYSLTDLNVRGFIKDFASSLSSEDPVSLEERLIIVEWKEGEGELLEEITFDQELNCRFTVIKTDNYSKVFEHLQQIDQGVAPSEINKYQRIIKRLIIDKGKEGALKSVLLSPIELDELERNLTSGNEIKEKVVVALGDSTVIFKIPNKLTYLEDYIFEKDELTSDVVLRFLANEPVSGRYPFIKYVSEEKIEESNLHDYEKEKLRQRLNSHGDLEAQVEKINKTYRQEFESIEKILSNSHVNDREFSLISYNINRLDFSEVEDYIREKVMDLVVAGESKINTNLRRLLLIYDLKKNKRSDA
ncbi:SIR2 family protein [Jeotgalibacillus salarius]|uniref:Uncharacterized protein n=1 Tax=Jeotgalibacillus salarius TaxID=546023 RepID=A0A4Y8LGF0_9BACL|nr:SIR2 family protein [Jeotgalibacillus salarius]TFE00667.1 hypothetical protein E2626_11890 [Jeotgalibacillus salarius]